MLTSQGKFGSLGIEPAGKLLNPARGLTALRDGAFRRFGGFE